MIQRPPLDQLTTTYNNKEWFYMSYKTLIQTTHWVDPLSGETVRLSPALKMYYHHRLDQYKAFTKLGKTYLESNRTVSDKLGIDYDMIRRDYNSLLCRMGLLTIDSSIPRKPIYTIFGLKYLRGWLINKKLGQHNTNTSKVKKKEKGNITYEDLKRIEKNKKTIDKIKNNLAEDYILITREDLERIRNSN